MTALNQTERSALEPVALAAADALRDWHTASRGEPKVLLISADDWPERMPRTGQTLWGVRMKFIEGQPSGTVEVQ